jgi:uncharacterized repeat protein (TIGR02543 family)
MKKTPFFARFVRFFETALVAGVVAFVSSNAYSADCPPGTKPQTNVFAERQECTRGYPHTGNSGENSPISYGTGTWIAYFPNYRIKGQAYCSSSVPENPRAVGSICPSLPRRAMAESINTDNSGTHCWCQATEYRQASTSTGLWNEPFQKIYAKYVYLKDMGNSCTDLCAAYCSYMTKNTILNGTPGDTVIGENLRATIYDSLLECIPDGNKITYISDDEVVDYQYYDDGSVVLKSDMVKPDYYFKGWCTSQTCTNPMAGGSTKTGWSGEKTLYAQWELANCGTGVKSQYKNGTLYCSTECADGYEEQFNPFSAQYSTAPNEQTFCYRTGNGSEHNRSSWAAYFSSFAYIVRGESFCSTTAPNISTVQVRDSACGSGILYPMTNEVERVNTGQYCWCKATEYEHTHDSSYLPKGITPLDAKYVYAGKPYNCSENCSSICGSIVTNAAYDGLDTVSLRVSMYRSLNKCLKKTYSLVLIDGNNIVKTISNYTIDEVILPTAEELPEHPGFSFVGWCEDLSDCDDDKVLSSGKNTGLFGDKTLYAKWNAVPASITYETNGGNLSTSAATTYTVDKVIMLEPTVSNDLIFEAWYDNPEFEGDPIVYLPTDEHQTESVTLYAKQNRVSMASGPTSGSNTTSGSNSPGGSAGASYVPASCGAGYEDNDTSEKILDASANGLKRAYRTHDGSTTETYERYLDKIKNGNASNGKWGVYFDMPDVVMYGTSSCNDFFGQEPVDNMVYSTKEAGAISESLGTGAYCWCKMTEFKRNNSVTEMGKNNNPDTPWVYVKKFAASGGKDAIGVCKSSCTDICSDRIRQEQFFRSQLYGDYATCRVKRYSIDYELNGGEWDENTVKPTQYTIAYQTLTIPNTLSKEYYTFGAWCENAGLTNCATIKTIPTGSSGDKKFYTKWTPVSYDITYNLPSDASWPVASVHPDTYNVESASITISNPTRNGYVFKGWCAGETDYCTDDNQLQKSYVIEKGSHGDITLWPHWDNAEYNITYKMMNGVNITGIELSKYTFSETDDIDLPSDIPMGYYTFVAWHTAQNSDSDTIVDKITAGTYGDLTFYAETTTETYDITYYKEGSTKIEGITPSSYDYGEGAILPTTLDDSVKPNYVFVGWYDNIDLTGDAITTISDVDTGAKEFWAKWEPQVYTITYHYNYDNDLTHEENYSANDFIGNEYQITYEPSSREYYRFDGWYTDVTDGTKVTFIALSDIGDKDLYAHWTRVACPDGHYLQGQNCGTCPTEFPYSNGLYATQKTDCYAVCESSYLTSPICSHATEGNCHYYDYIYNSYLDAESYLSDININEYMNAEHSSEGNLATYNTDWFIQRYYDNAGIASAACEVKITECGENYHTTNPGKLCEPDEYHITYHDGSSSLTDTEAVSYGLPIKYTYSVGTNLPKTITKPHYVFTAWHDDNNDVVTEISTTDYGDKHFWAEWDAEQLYIKFEHGVAGERTEGFTGNMQNQTVSYGKEVILDQNTFAMDGYEFAGWHCTALDKDGNKYEEDFEDKGTIEKYEFINNMTCTALWKVEAYKLYYICNPGDLAEGQRAWDFVEYDAQYTLNSSICAPRLNYALTHWTCTNNLKPTSSVWNITKDATCTAYWAENSYNISYKEPDGTDITDEYNLVPTFYSATVGASIVPTFNPSKAHFRFDGWCDDAALTQNCTNTKTIEANTNANKEFYAKWSATECPAGQYLLSTTCAKCPAGYTSTDWNAFKKQDCYKPCPRTCPEGGICDYVSATYDGLIHYGDDENRSCDFSLECETGYYINTISGVPDCTIQNYTITYYNTYNSNAFRPTVYNIKDSEFTINTPSRSGYVFAGWCVDSNNCDMPDKIITINPLTTLRNISLYAQWRSSTDTPTDPTIPDTTQCASGRGLHIGDDTVVCLSTTKPSTKPLLGLSKGNQKYYLQMTKRVNGSDGLPVNENSNVKWNVLYNGEVYNVHDDSVGNN